MFANGILNGAGLNGVGAGCLPPAVVRVTRRMLRAHTDLQGPPAGRVRSPSHGCLRPRSVVVVSGQSRVRIITWARLYSGRECLGTYLRRRAGARSLRPPRPVDCVNHQELEIAAAHLWPRARSQGYFEGWSLVEREGEAHVGLKELALPHPQDGRRFRRIYLHVPSAFERTDSTRTPLGVLGRFGRGLHRPDPTFTLASFR